jgi:transposase
VDIHVLKRQGMGIRAIARELGISRNTVRGYLRDKSRGTGQPNRAPRPSKLDPFKDYLNQRVEAARPQWIPATVLLRELRERGYDGGISILKTYLAPMKQAPAEPVRRFETDPGQQLQVDFTTIRRGASPLKALVATLGYSRASFVWFTRRETQADWIEGIERALVYLGGVPKELLFDNAKCIMLERDAYGEGKHRWNPMMLELSQRYGFKLRACRPYRAKTKGKVERFNRYLKDSFVTPLAATFKQAGLILDVDSANAHVGPWLHEVANARVHSVTQERPAHRLQSERLVLGPLPTPQAATSVPVGAQTLIPVESLQHPLSIYDRLLEAS